jgi:hypothetical protein
MDEIELSSEQEAEAERILDCAMAQARVELKQAARLLASKKNSELFGETEFQLRDAVHRIGARALDTALQERKKRGTKDAASPVPPAGPTPDS